MTNHAHLLIHINLNSLSQVMQYINYRYVRWFNRKYQKVGHLFQDRFRSIAVDDDEYLINLCHYIHFNPIEAHMVNDLADYPWSSHQYYVGKSSPKWLQINYISDILKNKTNKDYIQFLNEPIDRSQWQPAMRILDDGKIIFDEEVILKFKLEKDFGSKSATNKLSENDITNIVCKNLNIDYQSLCCSSRKRDVSHQRILLTDFWMKYANLTIVEIAKRFDRTHGTLLRQLAQLHSDKNQYFQPNILEKIQGEINALLE